MSANPNELTEEVSESSATPGDRLIEARKWSGYSEEDVAERLKVSVDYIRALETCAYDRLPGLTFTRGYIRSYAHILEIDADEIIKQFDDFVGDQSPSYKTATIRIEPAQASSGSPLVKWVSFLILAGVIGSTYYWWQSQQTDSAIPSSESAHSEAAPSKAANSNSVPSVTSSEAVSENASMSAGSDQSSVSNDAVDVVEGDLKNSAEPINDGGVAHPLSIQIPIQAPAQTDESAVQQVTKTVPLEISVIASETVVASVEDTAEETLTQSAVAEGASTADTIVEQEQHSDVVSDITSVDPVAETALSIRFNGDCWVEVRGQSGRVLVASLRNSSNPVEVNINEPVKVLLGNVGAVESLVFDNKSIALASFTRGNIANLTLGSEL